MCLGSVEGEKLRSSLLSGLAQMNWEEDIISDLLFGLFFVARRRKTHAELKVSCNKNLCVQCLLEMCSSFPLSSTPALGGGYLIYPRDPGWGPFGISMGEWYWDAEP